MPNFDPTDEQRRILEYDGNCVVIAKPGSGKTFVLSEKIRVLLPDYPGYKGVIAISYTNKASDELKSRSLTGGLDRKASFFGTIDKFYIAEIIIPFGQHLFGMPTEELHPYTIDTIAEQYQPDLEWITTKFNYQNLSRFQIRTLEEFFQRGIIVLEAVGILANYVYDQSQACRDYLRARYTHVMIDEYQDSGFPQHQFFLKLEELGLVAIAVGDLDQSIYAFSGRDPIYLALLTRQAERFRTFPLTKNHRCHPSIINYSTALMTTDFEVLETDENRVYCLRLKGSEVDIADWLNQTIAKSVAHWGVERMNEVAILVRGNRTGQIVDTNLTVPHKYFVNTPLDNDLRVWSDIFRKLLYLAIDKNNTRIEFLENYINPYRNKTFLRKIIRLIERIQIAIGEEERDVEQLMDFFCKIARLLNEGAENQASVNLLRRVLSTPALFDSFVPAKENEVQIMTLHKSKGLEFDIVFHLDLYEYIMPAKRPDPETGEWGYPAYTQDLNLHYVGITRARESCVLITSTERTNSYGNISNGNSSEFFRKNNVASFRGTWNLPN